MVVELFDWICLAAAAVGLLAFALAFYLNDFDFDRVMFEEEE